MRVFFLFVSLSQATSECDLSGSGIFVERKVGLHTFSEEHEIRRSRRNLGTGERLENPGILNRKEATLKLDKPGDFWDAWVNCKNDKTIAYRIKCFANQTYTINDKKGYEVELPDCTPLGCNKRLLPFPRLTEECKYGYHEGNFTHLEKNGNRCKRECTTKTGGVMTSRTIHCRCDTKTRKCSYMIKVKSGYVPWDSRKPKNGRLFVDSSVCKPNIGSRGGCSFMPAMEQWPKRTKCSFPGFLSTVPWENTQAMNEKLPIPQGTVCSVPCDKHEVKDYNYPRDETVCKFDWEHERFYFTSELGHKINQCIPALCRVDPDFIFGRFSKISKEMDIENFSRKIDCDDAFVPEFGTNPSSAKVGLGTTCVIKCKAGYKFKNHQVDKFPIKCSHLRDRTPRAGMANLASIVDWDVFADGYKFPIYDNELWREYPECIPVEETTTLESLTTTFEPSTTFEPLTTTVV